MKKFGFTLGEILIALSVIGVVASLILPQLVVGKKAAEAKAQFNTAYSQLAKVIADMDADNVSVDPVSYNASQSLYTKFKDYMMVTIDCGTYSAATKNTSVCIGKSSGMDDSADNYYTYNKSSATKANINRFDDGAFVLNNGMLVAFENPGNGDKWISVDINGKNKLPNRWGWDLFTFEFVKGEILPLGAPGTKATYSANPATYCNPNGNSSENGATCGFFAATDEDYFTKLYKGH